MKFEGKTLVRIYETQDGKMGYQAMLSGSNAQIGFALIGALEMAKKDIMEQITGVGTMTPEEVNDTRKMLGEEDV